MAPAGFVNLFAHRPAPTRMTVTPLKAADLEATLEKPGIVLVDCWAPWCGPCRTFAPIFERVAAKHPDATFLKADIDEEPELARLFGVRSIPTLVVFRDGVPLLARPGVFPEAALDGLVEEVKALDMAGLRQELSKLRST